MAKELDDATKAKVLKQLDFYFSDSNLPKDRFLKAKIAEDPNGYVDMKIVIAFARMREHLKLDAGVTEPSKVPDDVVAAVAALIKEGSQLLEVNAEATRLRRKQPLANDEVVSAEVDARSLYVRPFPLDTDLDKLTEFFASHAPVNCVRMRRHLSSKQFKGSVFVEFASAEDADKVLGLKLEHAGAPLHMEKKVAYMARKKEERAARRAANKMDYEEDSNDELSDGVGGKAGGPVVEGRAEIAKAAGGSKPAPAPAASAPAARKPAGGDEGKGKKRGREEDKAAGKEEDEGEQGDDEGEEGEGDEDEEMGEGGEGGKGAGEAKAFRYEPGHLLRFELEGEVPESVGPRVISDGFGGRDKVKFVELADDKKSGFLRFASADFAKAALAEFEAKPEGERLVATFKATMRAVEGEEEAEYYKRAQAASGNAGGRGGGRGGRRGGRG
eukprot:CAMPEP_0202857828 /NCGR_PEP_ID=MMETSP1391-20130828/618_1 /ASSEMBLY_ACC=CAM_ASM_000867 /TAXON_ID=1034604 /ORGANISM="Chlamydomonas leiostraca, Strain SAG 11-49" /LENGTH=442 /DNA_ID=CAMNT_0049536685 /DNA_START=156 /DNA_END=1480 /DNA_ORIENTATION=-